MSLDLDPRQRAMLQEMGVRVWWPLPVAEPAVLTRAPVSVPVLVLPVMAAEVVEKIAPPALTSQPAARQILKAPSQDAPAAPPDITALAEGLATMDWTTLAQTVANCHACKLCLDRRAPVFDVADMPRQADWLVVADPPDEAQERAGSPFVDQAGQLFDNLLKAVGVSRYRATEANTGATATTPASAAYVTHVVKCRPGVARNPEPQELALCANYLRREVALVQPKVIVVMGRFAAQTVLQGSLAQGSKIPYGKLRGQIYRYQGIPVVVTYPPVYLLRTPAHKARAWADLCLALQAVGRGVV